MNINDIIRLWYKTQHGHIEKCRKAQSEFDNIMWDLCEKLDKKDSLTSEQQCFGDEAI